MGDIIEGFLHSILVTGLFLWMSKLSFAVYLPVLSAHLVVLYASIAISKWLPSIIYLTACFAIAAYYDRVLLLIINILFIILSSISTSQRINFGGKSTLISILNWILLLYFLFSFCESGSLKIFYQLINLEILYQGWVLCRELCSFSADFKAGKKTGAILLGRYDSYRVFTLLHILLYVLTLFDGIALSASSIIPLLLIPWTCHFIFLIRNMKMKGFPLHYFCFLSAFSILQLSINHPHLP